MTGETTHDTGPAPKHRASLRARADAIRNLRCRNLVVVLECPTNPANTAGIIRTVNALGADHVLVIDPHRRMSDDWEQTRTSRHLLKASASASKWTYVRRFDSTQACIDRLAARRYASIATSPHVSEKTHAYLQDADFTTWPRLAIWFGTESRGLSDEAIAHARLCVSVPMYGIVESLNLATCAGIVLYEATRQRRAYSATYRHPRQRGLRESILDTDPPQHHTTVRSRPRHHIT